MPFSSVELTSSALLGLNHIKLDEPIAEKHNRDIITLEHLQKNLIHRLI